MTTEVEVFDKTYEIGKMPVRDQFHVVRRLAPVIKSVTLLTREGTQKALESGEMNEATILSEMLVAVSQMSDEDCDYIMNKCLSRVRLKQENGQYARIWEAGRLMFEDTMTMPETVRLVFEVIQENIGSFSLSPQET